jgi:cellular nucleic acid-binding protein
LDTEPSLSESEKAHLLNHAFSTTSTSADNDDVLAVPLTLNGGGNDARDGSMSDDSDDDDDCLAMFGDDDNDTITKQNNQGDDGPPQKRHKMEENYGTDVTSTNENGKPHIQLTVKQQDQLDMAKNKLSKWAARLFDPNRPRGLIEAPKVIPLNDEFLTAFGKREKEFDEIAGRVVHIDKTSLDIIDVSDDDDENEESSRKLSTSSKDGKKLKFSEMSSGKVKITNLSYKTTSATIAKTFELIGPVIDVNLILDDLGQSSGRAYVVFEDHESALNCVATMNEKTLEGRTIHISLASKSLSSSSSSKKGMDSSRKQQDNRYWERDISTKCNSCGGVGHIARNCPNEPVIRCGLCAEEGHDMWTCPQKSVCFNCGLPGHMVRDCMQRRGLPQRCVCTICLQSNHHRFRCRERPWDVPMEDALCMQTGKRGQFMNTEMRWFFGLKGVSCFRCGMKDHRGVDCRRPDVETCQKNPELAQREIDMADTISLNDQMSSQRSNRESRDHGRSRESDNNRARSMPPPSSRGNGFGNGSNGQSSHRRFY